MTRYRFISVFLSLGLVSVVACGISPSKAVTSPTAAGSATTTIAAQAGGATTVLPTSTTVTKEKAADFVKRLIGYMIKGQSGRAYDVLHPAQQALVTRAQYMHDDSSSLASATAAVTKVIETYTEQIEIPGTGLTVPSTAVTIELTATLLGKTQVMPTTVHAIMDNGQWRWTMTSDALTAAAAVTP